MPKDAVICYQGSKEVADIIGAEGSSIYSRFRGFSGVCALPKDKASYWLRFHNEDKLLIGKFEVYISASIVSLRDPKMDSVPTESDWIANAKFQAERSILKSHSIYKFNSLVLDLIPVDLEPETSPF